MAINTKKTNVTEQNNISGNIDLGFSVKKKRFTVGGDPNLVIEFDPTDLGVANRLSKALPEFNKLNDKWAELNASAEKLVDTESVEDAESTANEFSTKFDELEKRVRDIIDEVFDGEVADKLLGNIAKDGLKSVKETLDKELNSGEYTQIGGID